MMEYWKKFLLGRDERLLVLGTQTRARPKVDISYLPAISIDGIDKVTQTFLSAQ